MAVYTTKYEVGDKVLIKNEGMTEFEILDYIIDKFGIEYKLSKCVK